MQIAYEFFIFGFNEYKTFYRYQRLKKGKSYPITFKTKLFFKKRTSISLGQTISLDYWDDKNEKVKRAFKGTSSVSKLSINTTKFA